MDQIHLWGVTDFRDFVIRHLKPWHAFGKECYINDVGFMNVVPDMGTATVDGKPTFRVPAACIRLPQWTEHVTKESRRKLQERAVSHMRNAYANCQADLRAMADNSDVGWACNIGECAGESDDGRIGPGYPFESPEGIIIHLREFHELNDEDIANFVGHWERTQYNRLLKNQSRTKERGDTRSTAGKSQHDRKRGLYEEERNDNASKRRRR